MTNFSVTTANCGTTPTTIIAASGTFTRYFAEGATGGFFDTYVLLGNPNPTPATATVTYLLASGDTIVRSHTIGASARLTIDIESEGDPRLLDAAVSTTVASDMPIVVERALYWGDASGWY